MANSAIGSDWEDFRKEHYTPEEIARQDLKAALIVAIIKSRREKKLSQEQLEELSGVKQSAIARLESGSQMPSLSTLVKLLTPLGKKLAVVDI